MCLWGVFFLFVFWLLLVVYLFGIMMAPLRGYQHHTDNIEEGPTDDRVPAVRWFTPPVLQPTLPTKPTKPIITIDLHSQAATWPRVLGAQGIILPDDATVANRQPLRLAHTV